MLGIVSVNYALTRPRCENGTSKCGEDRNKRSPSLHGMPGGQQCSNSLQGDDLHQGWVGSLLGTASDRQVCLKMTVNQMHQL